MREVPHRTHAGKRGDQLATPTINSGKWEINMPINKVGVIGTGAMGLGITQVVADSGIDVVAVKATPGSWERAKKTLEGGLAKAVERGKMPADKRDALLARTTFSADEHAVAECDLVIESIIEDLQTKKALFRRLEHVCRPDAISCCSRRCCRGTG